MPPVRPAPQAPLTDDQFTAGLSGLVQVVEASGFVLDSGHAQPSWVRIHPPAADGTERGEKVVLWRHPRMPWEVHGHVASSLSEHAVHLRFFDPEWKPQRIMPGHIDKGFVFESAKTLRALANKMVSVIWPRALAWFEAPASAEEILGSDARLLSLVRPGPLLEHHRARAAWLETQGRTEEAAFMRGLVAEVEALFDQKPALPPAEQ